MAEGLFDIQADDLGNLVAAYEQMAADADDIEDALMEAGREVQRRTIDNYMGEGILTDLGFWIMLSSPYEQWKERNYPGRRMLELHDPSPLEDAVVSADAVRMRTPNEVAYVIEDEKAPWHQFGADRSHGGILPPRPIIPDVGDIEPYIHHVFVDWVDDIVEHTYARVKDMPWAPNHPWFRPRSSLGTFLPLSD